MFRETVVVTPFTSGVADTCFKNIKGDSYYGDVSFVSTLRALLAGRIGDGDTVTVSHKSSSYSLSTIRDASANALIDAMTGYLRNATGSIFVHNVNNNTDEAVKVNMDVLNNNFLQRLGAGWEKVQRVTDFFRKSFEVLCFINREKKNVVLYIGNLTNQKLHFLQIGTLGFLPWYFDPEKGISDDEHDLLYSLKEKTNDKYLEVLNRMIQNYDLRSVSIKAALSGFETRYERQRMREVQSEIDSIRSSIENYKRYIRDYLESKRSYDIELLGLESRVNSGDEKSEIMDYFLANKSLVLEGSSGTNITFGVRTYLDYYDEDMLKAVLDNERSYVYYPHGSHTHKITDDDMKRLMTAIFIDQKLRMRVCGVYEIRASGSVHAQSGWNYSMDYMGYTPNTHLDRFACLGDYEYSIEERITEHDMIGAVEQCVASCKSLNFGDSPVMNEFMARLYGVSDYGTNVKCIELPDGSVVDPTEAIAWLKKEDSNE